MLIRLLHKIFHGINYYGFSYFVYLKMNEFRYKRKFLKLGLTYPNPKDDSEFLNDISFIKDTRPNQGSAYYAIKKAIGTTKLIREKINLLDIGCGDGKVLNFGMLLNFNTVIGIDLDKNAIKKATLNCIQMKGRGFQTEYNVQDMDAYNYAIPAGTNVIFLFNPFGKLTMEQVAENILTYQAIHKIAIYLIYLIAVHKKVFENHKAFIKIYEKMSAGKINTEMVVFKIEAC